MYLDTDILYALLRAKDRLAPIALEVTGRKDKQYTSTITLVELEILFKREISDELSQRVTELVRTRFPDLSVEEVNLRTIEQSLELRRKYNLGIFDSIHAAVALQNDRKIASTDTAFDRIPGLKRIT